MQVRAVDHQLTVAQAICSRRSVRAFLPTPVRREVVEQILTLAARAPSGTNIQPWKVTVLSGAAKNRLSAAILAVCSDPAAAAAHTEEYAYYPRQWVPPYLARRRKLGLDLYALLGLTRENKAGMAAQHARNFSFFDAPIGLIFTIDRVLEQGSWLDYGMFLQSVMLAARAHGLDTCPQAAFTQFHTIIEQQLGLPDSEMVVCGMSLGYADLTKGENSLVSERAPLSSFARFCE